MRRRQGEERAVDDDRLRLEPARLPGVVDPGDLEIADVLAIDLPQARIANLLGTASVGLPRSVLGRRQQSEEKEEGPYRHSVFKNAMSAAVSSADSRSPNSCPGTAFVSTP